MLTRIALAIIFCLPILSQAESHNLVELANTADFDTHLKDHEFVVVDFFATWCGPCKQLAPALAKLADELSHVFFVKVDTDNHAGIGSKYGVKGLPTIIIFKDGKEIGRLTGYAGDMTIKKIKEHVGTRGTHGAVKPAMPVIPAHPATPARPATPVHPTPKAPAVKAPIEGRVTEIDGKRMIISEEIVEQVSHTPAAPSTAVVQQHTAAKPVKTTPHRMKGTTQKTTTRSTKTSYPRRRGRTETVTPAATCTSCTAR